MSDDTSSRKHTTAVDTRAAWGPARAVVGWVASFFGAQLAVYILLSVVTDIWGASGSELKYWYSLSSTQFLLALCVEAFVLGILWLFLAKFSRQQIIQGLGLRKPRIKDGGYMLLGVLLYFGIYVAIMTVVASVTAIDLDQQQDIGFDGARGFPDVAWVFTALVILPPIVEEIIFRGYLYGGFRKANGMVVSAVMTSIIFGYLHSTQAVEGGVLWTAAIDTFIMSLVLCYLREKSGSILPGMGVHAIKNGVAFIAIFILHL